MAGTVLAILYSVLITVVSGRWQAANLSWSSLTDVTAAGPQARYYHTLTTFFDDGFAKALCSGGLVQRASAIKVKDDSSLSREDRYAFENLVVGSEVWLYDFREGAWKLLFEAHSDSEASRVSRFAHTMDTWIDAQNVSHILMFGGQTLDYINQVPVLRGDVLMYTPDTNQDSSFLLPAHDGGRGPGARSAHVSTIVDTRYYVIFGGFTTSACRNKNTSWCVAPSGEPIIPLNDLWVIDLTKTWTWREIVKLDMPPARYFASMICMQASIWLLGGADNQVPMQAGRLQGSTALNETGVWHISSQLLLDDSQQNGWLFEVAQGSSDAVYNSRGFSSQMVGMDDSRFIVAGGQISERNPKTAISLFDADTKMWTEIPPTMASISLIGRVGMAATQVDGILVAYGGRSSFEMSSDVELYDLKDDLWTREAQFTVPVPRSFSSMVYFEAVGSLIVYGGLSGSQALSDIWTLSTFNSVPKWYLIETFVPKMPGRFGHASAVADGMVFVFFGISDHSGVLNDCWSADANLDFEPCNVLNDPPAPRAMMACGSFKTQSESFVLFHGGLQMVDEYATYDSNYVMYSSVIKYTPSTGLYSAVATTGISPGARAFHSHTVITVSGTQCLAILGGDTSSKPDEMANYLSWQAANNHLYLLDTTHMHWHEIPSSPTWPPSLEAGLLFAGESMLGFYGGQVMGSERLSRGKYSATPVGDLYVTSMTSLDSANFVKVPVDVQFNRSANNGVLMGSTILSCFGQAEGGTYAQLCAKIRLSCDKGEAQTSDIYTPSACVRCSQGTYISARGQSSCIPCPPGTTTKLEGSTSESSCNVCMDNHCGSHGSCFVDDQFQVACNCAPGWKGSKCDYNPRRVAAIATTCTVLFVVTVALLIRRHLRHVRHQVELSERLLSERTDELVELERAFEVKWDELNLVKRIDLTSPGATGEVWQAIFNDTPVAVKKLKLSHDEDIDQFASQEFEDEIKFMRTLRHRNVVFFYGCGFENRQAFLVLEFLSRGSLSSLLRDESVTLEWSRRVLMARDAACGMQFLHALSPPRVHRDLKSPNLLVSEGWCVKVGDFGTSRLLQTFTQHSARHSRWGAARQEAESSENLLLTRGVGTLLWTAPEVHEGTGYTLASDVYSYGVVMWELASRKVPWSEIRHVWDVRAAVEQGRRPAVDSDTLGACPAPFVRVMQACWAAIPSDRMTFNQVVDALDELLSQIDL